jgi:O-antigen ligase
VTGYPERLVELSLRLPAWATVLVCGTLAAALGWTYVDRPTLAVLPAVLLLALPLMLSARVRLLVVVFGALTVLQTSDELTAAKLLYFFALAVSFGAALFRLPRLVGTPAYRDLGPLFRASIVTLALVAISLPVSVLSEVPQKAWLRDVAPYAMVAFAPVFALDAQASMTARALRRVLVIGGTLGAIGFTTRWLTNRGIADLSFVPLGLATLLLASTVFAYGIATLLHGSQRRLSWGVLTSLVFAMLLSTGTRTALVLLAAPVAIVAGAQHRLVQRSIRLVVVAPLVAILVFFGAQGVVRVTNADQDVLAARTSLLFETGDRSTDQSYIDRLAQTAASWEAFRSSPLLGTGPGKPILWTNSFNEPQVTTVVDTPVSFLAKFGVAGLVAAAFLLVGFVSTLRAFRARTGRATIAQLALIGYGAVVAGWSLLQNPYEDKGFAIGLMLLLAVAAREASDATRRDSSSTDASPHRERGIRQ